MIRSEILAEIRAEREKVLHEIRAVRDEAIAKGFDWPRDANPEDEPTEILTEFLEEVKQFLLEEG